MDSLSGSSAALLHADALVAQLKAISACERNLALSLRMASVEVRRSGRLQRFSMHALRRGRTNS
jgi:hypothetical protein